MDRKVVTFGELMVRFATPDKERFEQARSFEISYCGSEANVAVSLARFGVQAEFVTRVPINDIASAANGVIRKEGVGTSSWVWGGERLGSFYLETGAMNRPSKVIYDRSNSAFAEIACGMIDWTIVFARADWFHWSGITLGVSPSAAEVCYEAVQAAKNAGITVSCDLNFRRQLWRDGRIPATVMERLLADCDMIFGNEEDCDCIFGIKPEGIDVCKTKGVVDAANYEVICRRMVERFPRCRKIALTLRGAVNADYNTWGGILYADGELYVSRRYELTHIVDRVGSGDSFAGGLIFSLLTNPNDYQAAVDFAAAASALKHSIRGDFNCVSAREVESLLGGNDSGRVQR
jgi:2-dehydro-3-deoxygluconokinase